MPGCINDREISTNCSSRIFSLACPDFIVIACACPVTRASSACTFTSRSRESELQDACGLQKSTRTKSRSPTKQEEEQEQGHEQVHKRGQGQGPEQPTGNTSVRAAGGRGRRREGAPVGRQPVPAATNRLKPRARAAHRECVGKSSRG